MKARTLLSTVLVAASALGFAQDIISTSGYGNVAANAYLGGSHTVLPNRGVKLDLANPQSLLKIDLPAGSNWSQYTHLQMTVQNLGNKPELFFIAIASTGIWCYTEVLLSPLTTQRIIMPLDNQPISGLFRNPQPAGTPAFQINANMSVDKPHVQWLMLEAPSQSAPCTFLISELKPVNTPIPTTNFVDTYGQQATTNWRGKITQDSQLAPAVNARQLSGNYPFSADVYGGVNGTAQSGSATGFWHTAKQNGKWFIIDPLGNRFFSSGVVGAGKGTPAMITGREQAFLPGALPSQTGPFAAHYEFGLSPQGIPGLTFDFYNANIQRRVGAAWADTLLQNTIKRMRTWGFTTAGPSSLGTLQWAASQTPFTDIVETTGTYAKVYDPSSGKLLPDVYDPTWAPAVSACLAPTVARLSSNNYSLGLFVDNEPPFAKAYSFQNADYGLCESIIKSPANQPAKIGFMNWLKQRYGNNISAFNASWQMSLGSFEALLPLWMELPENVPAGMAADMRAFTLNYARTYFGTIRSTLKNLGYKGLYLGSRLLFYTPEVLQAYKENSDVVSFHIYQHRPTDHHEELKALDAPVMISEVGFGACDMGRRPATPNLLSEAERANYFKEYLTDAMSWQNLVGLHWYKWEDDIVSGRSFDGDNISMGLISITDIPYWPMIDVASAGNIAFNQRLLNP